MILLLLAHLESLKSLGRVGFKVYPMISFPLSLFTALFLFVVLINIPKIFWELIMRKTMFSLVAVLSLSMLVPCYAQEFKDAQTIYQAELVKINDKYLEF